MSDLSRHPRILFILGVLWGENGITTHLTTLSRSLIEQGWNVAIATNIGDTEEAKCEAAQAIAQLTSIGVQYFPVPFPFLKLAPEPCQQAARSLKKLDQIVRAFQPDILHLHSLSMCPYAALIRLRYRIPYVSTCHLDPDVSRSDIKFGSRINRVFKRFLGDRAFAVSSDLKRAFETVMNIPSSLIHLVYYGIDDRHFRPPTPQERQAARRSFNLSDDAKVVCLIGRLSPVKGHDVLIQALSLLRFEGLEIIALCAGKGYGHETETVQQQSTIAGVSDLVRLLGATDARQVLWASDAIVLPSRREASPLSIQEAMLCGTVPIRTPAAGAYDQIEQGISGFIVPFDDPQALAERLKEIVNDPAMRSQMSAAALALAQQKFTVRQMTQTAIALYQDVIRETHPAKYQQLFAIASPVVPRKLATPDPL